MAARSPGVEQEPAEHIPDASDTSEASDALAKRDSGWPGIDPDGVYANQEPSVEWGWHGGFPRASRIAGWVTAAALFLMLLGNHQGSTENYWLITLGTGLVIALLADERRRRRSWHR